MRKVKTGNKSERKRFTILNCKLSTANWTSQRGGISSVIAEIIFAVIMLSLIVTVIIPSFNKSREMVEIAGKKENQLSNLKSLGILDLSKDTFLGNDVIAAIRYYSDINSVSVDVTTVSGQHLYINETYNEDIFNIPRDDIYLISLIYEDKKIKGVFFTPNT